MKALLLLLLISGLAQAATTTTVPTESAIAKPGTSDVPPYVKIIGGYDGTTIRMARTDALGNLLVASTPAAQSVISIVRNDYTITPVTTGAWVQLIPSTPSDIKQVQIFDSSGQTLEIGLGAAGFEVPLFYVFPGGNGNVGAYIPSGSRVSIKAVSANASVGEADLNFFY